MDKGIKQVGGLSARVGNKKPKRPSTSKTPEASPHTFWPAELTPLPHQLEAVEWATSRDKSYLAADPGLGKTIMAAIIQNRLGLYAFYVCPPFLVSNTESEFKKWGMVTPPIVLPDSMLTKPLQLERFRVLLKSTKKHERILFVDEAHRFKNLKADRTKFLFTHYVSQFDKVVFMSGTPMPNSRPMELWPALRAGAPDVFGYNFFNFALKYCGAFKGPFG
jgi:SNF2 family DNA or RNA helicase